MDAAEIARMKAEAIASPDAWWSPGRLALIDALEQARKERDWARALELDRLTLWTAAHEDLKKTQGELYEAQKDAKDARALLGALREAAELMAKGIRESSTVVKIAGLDKWDAALEMSGGVKTPKISTEGTGT